MPTGTREGQSRIQYPCRKKKGARAGMQGVQAPACPVDTMSEGEQDPAVAGRKVMSEGEFSEVRL